MRVGAIELRLLEHVAARGATSVREASESFGRDQNIGLTTVSQMLERLRRKELLTREQVGGVWVYRAVQSREKVLRDVVKDFVERTLGGSLEPFALYLADPTNVTKEDLAQLRAIVDKLDDAKESRDA